MTARGKGPAVREAVGTFFDRDHLQAAIDELAAAGFGESELGLLAAEDIVKGELGDLYTRINQSADTAEGPVVAFVADESMGDTVHAMLGTLFMVGTTVASGLVVASAAVLGGALLAGVAGVAAMGATSGAMSLVIHQNEAEHLEQQVDEGHMLLFVRAPDSAEEARAVEILSRHGAFEARLIEGHGRAPEPAPA